MKEYIKLFEGLNAANGYEINDTPFTSTIKQVSGETAINLRCNKPDASIIIEDGKPRILTEVTITSVWNPTVSDKNTKVIIQGEVVLNGKVDCYSIEFAQGGHLTINAGARLRIWEGGIVNSDTNTIEYFEINSKIIDLNYTNIKFGEILFYPNLSIDNIKAKINVITNCYMKDNQDKVWMRFCIPFNTTVKPSNNYNGEPLVIGDKLNTYASYWDNITGSWLNLTNWTQLESFKLIDLSNNISNGTNITYTFHENIILNNNININKQIDYFYIGNSYLSKIKTKLLEDLFNEVYFNDISQHKYIKIDADDYPFIQSGQIFLLKTNINNITLSYKDLVWNTSFEDDITLTPTRSLKSSTKSELILPDSPIFSNPTNVGEPISDIDNSNLK